MAQRSEIECAPQSLPYPNLRDRIVVKKLLEERRIPILIVTDGEEVFENVTCFVPQGKKEPPLSYLITKSDALEFVKLRNELLRNGEES